MSDKQDMLVHPISDIDLPIPECFQALECQISHMEPPKSSPLVAVLHTRLKEKGAQYL